MSRREGELIRLACDQHRPRRVYRVVEIDPAVGMRLEVLPDSTDDCDWCASYRAIGPNAGWYGLAAEVVPVAELQGALW